MAYDFEAGEILLLNKPLTWTSFDIVKKVRNLLRIKKIGHAGTCCSANVVDDVSQRLAVAPRELDSFHQRQQHWGQRAVEVTVGQSLQRLANIGLAIDLGRE